MKKEMSISNRLFYTLITIIIVSIICGGVYAWANVNGIGHDLDEINLPSCSNGQVLSMVGGNWNCVSLQQNPSPWDITSDGIEYKDGYVGIGEGVGSYDEDIKLHVKGAVQLNVFTSFSTAPPCTSLTRGTIILVTTWEDFPRDKMYTCLYNINSYEYIRVV